MSWSNRPVAPAAATRWPARPADITVADIIVSVDEPIDATQCGGKENCLGEAGRCMTHDLWASLNQRMVEFLDSVTLQKLVDEQLAKGVQIEDKPMVKRAIPPHRWSSRSA
jgi:Rrf2 family iron-sulfur cluster assembly transcriptional regulator